MSTPVTITEAAALQIKDMMKEHEEENAFLRVGVKAAAAAVSHTAWALTMKSQRKTRSSNSTASMSLSIPKALIS
ncbi:hypothetical protein BsIDN1_56680 [Bacillus safensis]|uniref:Uncharacterized protein n=1 Tax=Bacillus safensis TaxID=561879 RepID=A0A5S9MEW1_BACIA|nr:hypothetical protein BsIDN1_56680 [Bacillus safensis]